MLQLLLMMASTVCACLPMFAFLAAIWWLDRYDREPVWLLALTFLWGAVGAVGLAIVCSVVSAVIAGELLGWVNGVTEADLAWTLDAVGPVVVAPLVEEPAKALILVFVIWTRHFDNMTDGFVYGAAAGLGFAMTENFLYFLNASDNLGIWSGTVIIRTLYSGVMHATASAVVGAALGFARFRGPFWLVLFGVAGLVVAFWVHALWNGLITYEALAGGSGAYFGMNLLIFPMEFGFTFLVFQVCLFHESLTIRQELAEEAEAGRLPTDHPRILASTLRRLRRGWLPPGVNLHRYIEAATLLAMRKRQLRQLGRRASPFYAAEVARLRDRVEALLAKAA